MSKSKHPVTRCAWCQQRIRRGGRTSKGKRGARYCGGGCGPKPRGKP